MSIKLRFLPSQIFRTRFFFLTLLVFLEAFLLGKFLHTQFFLSIQILLFNLFFIKLFIANTCRYVCRLTVAAYLLGAIGELTDALVRTQLKHAKSTHLVFMNENSTCSRFGSHQLASQPASHQQCRCIALHIHTYSRLSVSVQPACVLPNHSTAKCLLTQLHIPTSQVGWLCMCEGPVRSVLALGAPR